MAFQILEDSLSPAAKRIGEGLQDLVDLACTPIAKLKLKRDANLELFKKQLNEKIRSIDQEKLTEPQPEIVGPALEDICKYCHDKEHLRSLFASLIASSMNMDKREFVHPSFGSIIKELSPDEAKLLLYLFKHPYFKNWRYPLVGIKYISGHITDDQKGTIIKRLYKGTISIIGTEKSLKDFNLGFTLTNHISLDGYNAECEHPERFPQYVENLARLKLVDIVIGKSLYNYEKEYTEIIKSQYLDGIIKECYFAQNEGESFYGFPLNYYEITEFGKQFLHCCMDD